MTYTVKKTEGDVEEVIASNGTLEGIITDLQAVQAKESEEKGEVEGDE